MIRTGTISINPRGFGFLVIDDDKAGQAAFVAPPDLNPLLMGDRVRAEVTESGDGRLQASRIELISRPRVRAFGQVVVRHGAPYVRVDREVSNTDWRLQIPAELSGRAREGAYVLVRIERGQMLCERVLDEAADAASEQILARHDIRVSHPPFCAAEKSEAEVTDRRDLREVPTVTIDAPSTRDIDDAISALPADSEGAMRILVSIADVSSEVSENSALDREALLRSTSVYLPDRVLPMFPTWLSEETMSLVQGQDRRCLTVELRIDTEGQVTSVDIYRSVIRSSARLSYEEVAAFLDHGEVNDRTDPVRDMLGWCRTASARLSVSRARRGGVEFAFEDAQLVVDANTRRVTVAEPMRNTSAHMLVERFMVAANEAVARWLHDRGIPAPYRVHDEPSTEATRELEDIARNFGFHAGFGHRLTPLALSALQRQIANAPAAPAIMSVLAKALGPATYTIRARQHFGLGASLYLHFTSPIRRYADLMAHRAVTRYLDGHRPTTPCPEEMDETCVAINERVRRAEKAERECRRVAAARYMASQIGSLFAANVTGVRSFGLLVQLTASLIVGTIPLENLPDGPYRMQNATRELVGPASRYAIGMPISVRLVNVDEMLGRVEFALVR